MPKKLGKVVEDSVFVALNENNECVDEFRVSRSIDDGLFHVWNTDKFKSHISIAKCKSRIDANIRAMKEAEDLITVRE